MRLVPSNHWHHCAPVFPLSSCPLSPAKQPDCCLSQRRKLPSHQSVKGAEEARARVALVKFWTGLCCDPDPSLPIAPFWNALRTFLENPSDIDGPMKSDGCFSRLNYFLNYTQCYSLCVRNSLLPLWFCLLPPRCLANMKVNTDIRSKIHHNTGFIWFP